MKDKFNEKLLASPEEIEKPIQSVDAYVARNKNQPSKTKRNRGRGDFHLDDAIERRRIWRKLRSAVKKQKGTGNKILLVESANYDDKGWPENVEEYKN